MPYSSLSSATFHAKVALWAPKATIPESLNPWIVNPSMVTFLHLAVHDAGVEVDVSEHAEAVHVARVARIVARVLRRRRRRLENRVDADQRDPVGRDRDVLLVRPEDVDRRPRLGGVDGRLDRLARTDDDLLAVVALTVPIPLAVVTAACLGRAGRGDQQEQGDEQAEERPFGSTHLSPFG